MSVTKITANLSAIQCAEKALALCKSGVASSFFCVLERDNGDYQFIGSTTKNRTQMAGILLEAAVERLGFKAYDVSTPEI